ncbi:MAG: hypothetical protein SXQ77_03045 [Halobacteria archaeon]|nr:hypothetical protein [Halobacteria archaeon]
MTKNDGEPKSPEEKFDEIFNWYTTPVIVFLAAFILVMLELYIAPAFMSALGDLGRSVHRYYGGLVIGVIPFAIAAGVVLGGRHLYKKKKEKKKR